MPQVNDAENCLTWNKVELNAAADEMRDLQHQANQEPGRFHPMLVASLKAEKARLEKERNGLQVWKPEAQARHAEIAGEIRMIDQMLSPLFGLSRDIERALKDVEKRARGGR